ncbi:BRO family protein [Metasolibacillus sp.]|uniref:BRO-N domain-containing protein n=1 Tax=Metasolibacillus sp. TaxID=2703680 RepID=UPI0025F8A432|nr:BRO family protein [Metasolibacillus sp.]MCT6924099.1 phage repressor protein [Metasolibacillus sp.]MCT6940206.1 phage repressor protein [Metasolibacillus sp.]
MNVKTEYWMDCKIRFIWHKEEWYAIARDIATALNYINTSDMLRYVKDEEEKSGLHLTKQEKRAVAFLENFKDFSKVSKMLLLTESGIYEAVWNSPRSEAKEFKKWVKQMLKQLRQDSGLEGFQIFRMLDKEHQKETMARLSQSLQNPTRVNFIKANTIANKAVSTRYGHPKSLKKDQMTPSMLIEREPILADAVDLMIVKDKFNLDLSVSEEVYKKYVH